MQILNLTPSERLTLEQALLAALSGAILKNHQGDALGKCKMTTVSITTVSATRTTVTFIYNHDDADLTNPGVWPLEVNRLRMYFDDSVVAIFARHGVINN